MNVIATTKERQAEDCLARGSDGVRGYHGVVLSRYLLLLGEIPDVQEKCFWWWEE